MRQNKASKKYYETHKVKIKRRRAIQRGSLEHKYSRLKSLSKERNRKMTLTFEQYAEIVKSKVCSYCGGQLPKQGYGLDRKNHREDYVFGNCVSCCWNCNFKKGLLESAGFEYPRTIELLRELNDSHRAVGKT